MPDEPQEQQEQQHRPGSRDAVAAKLRSRNIFGAYPKASPEPAPAATPESQEAAAPVNGADEDAQGQRGLLDAQDDALPLPEGANEDESTKQDAPQEAAEADDEQSVQSLSDLATSLDVDTSALLELRAATKIDGEEGEVTLKELLASYQQQGHVNRKSMQVSRQQREQEQAHAEKMGEVDARMAQAGQMLEFAKQELIGEFQQVNWDELRLSDPMEYQTRWVDAQRKMGALNQKVEQYTQAQQQRSQQQQQESAATLERERQLTLEAVPEWVDTKVAARDMQQMQEYLRERGYTEDQIGSLNDHRLILVLRDALKGISLQKSGKTLTRAVRKAPKGLKTASRDTTAGVRLGSVDKARAAMKKKPSTENASALIKAKRAQAVRRGQRR